MSALLRYQDPRANERDWAEVLETFPLFATVGKRELRKLVRSATFAELARGDRITSRAGTDSLYVVLSGEATMLHPTPRLFRTGDYFGELSLLGGRTHSLHVVATRELHLMKLARRPVLEFARRHPLVTHTLLKDLALRLQPAVAAGVC
jgi:CRP-like cAMP-binding protein